MNLKCARFFVFLTILENSLCESNQNFNLSGNGRRILSRKKRFLVFPEGSSLQLIFDWVVPMVGMPNIFTIGITAALAWQLPHDPTAPFRRPAEVIHRRVDEQQNNTEKEGNSALKYQELHRFPYYINGVQRFPYKSTYVSFYNIPGHETMLGSPAYRYNLRKKYWRGANRDDVGRLNRNYIDLVYDEVHRTTRRDLYAKLRKILTLKQRDAKACLLKVMCQVGQFGEDEKGTFWEEILKTIFRVRISHVDEKDEYDLAGNTERDCEEMYPTCSFYK